MSPIHALVTTPPRRAAAWGLVAAVTLVHGWLLDPWLRPAPPPAYAATSMHTRLIVAAAPEAAAAALPDPAPAPRTAAAVAPAPVETELAALPAATHATSVPMPAQVPVPVPVSVAVPVPVPVALAAPPPVPESTHRLPTYPTAPPPSTRVHFTLERGSQRGEATLDWAVEGDRYTLRLQAEVEGRPVLGSVSRGAFDAAGLAPERFVETRRHRELRAANFERDAGAISFSGPGHRAELAAGAQDRLSWWLQLAAVLQADPGLREVTLSVTGARGDSRVWTFTAQPSADGDTTGLRHFHRAAQHPDDTAVDVWLDPAAHHLPARVRLLFRQGGEVTTFTRTAAR